MPIARKPAPKRPPASKPKRPATVTPPIKAKAKRDAAPARTKLGSSFVQSKTAKTAPKTAKTAPAPKPAPERQPALPPKAKRSRGKPLHVPDKASQNRVTVWSGGGIEQELIAQSLGISRPTLVKHYADQLAVGKATMDGLAVSALAAAMQRGGKEAVVAAKWWTQSRMNWVERVVVDDGKPGDTPMRVIVELVGDAPTDQHQQARTRPTFDATTYVEFVG
jgi:hypothetical protein